MPVDTSIYANGPKPVNALEMMGQMTGLQGQMQQNQLRARTMAGMQAQGEADASATSPDGSYDPKAALATLAQDPRGAYAMHQATIDAQAQQQAQLAQHVQQVELGMKQMSFLTQQLGSVADNPNATGKDLTNIAGLLVQHGIIDSKMAATELANAPTDDSKIPAYARTLQMRAMASGDQLAAYHHNLMLNTGPTVVPVNDAPLATPGSVQMGLSPGEAASPVAGPQNPDGSPTTVPLGQRAGMGVVTTGNSPTAQAAGGAYGGQVGNQVATFEAAAREAPAMDSMLKNMRGDLTSLSTGPGSDQRNKFWAGLNSLLGTNIDASKVSDQESFNKAAAQVVAKQRQMMGLSGTDAQLSAAEHASPGSALSQRGNEANISIIRGNNDYLQAQGNLWNKAKQSGAGPQDFPRLMGDLQNYVSPLPFQLQHMAPDQRTQLLNSMSPGDKAKAAHEVDFARKNGLIPPRFDR